jgi:hypothetical protein
LSLIQCRLGRIPAVVAEAAEQQIESGQAQAWRRERRVNN